MMNRTVYLTNGVAQMPKVDGRQPRAQFTYYGPIMYAPRPDPDDIGTQWESCWLQPTDGGNGGWGYVERLKPLRDMSRAEPCREMEKRGCGTLPEWTKPELLKRLRNRIRQLNRS